MKVTGEIMQRVKEEGEDGPILTRQMICCVINLYTTAESTNADHGNGSSIKPQTVKYPKKSTETVKWLSVMQILAGLMMIGCQIAPMYWGETLLAFRDVFFSLQYSVPDKWGCGLWCGIPILIAGVIGVVASKKNIQGMIIVHLVLNLLAVLFAIALTTLASVSLTELLKCKNSGNHIEASWYDSEDSAPIDREIYGEKFSFERSNRHNHRSLNYLYCVNGIFTAWIVLEFSMILAAGTALVTSLWLLVKNSMALCFCCQKCCTSANEKVESDEEVLVDN